MKIWIDGKEANVPDRLGSGQVAFELIKGLSQYDLVNEYTVLLPAQARADLPASRSGFSYKILKPNRLWTRIALPLTLYKARKKPDLIFSPTHYIPRFSPVPCVVTIFDLAYLHFPEMFPKKDLWQLTNWTKYSVENAKHIVTISQSAKKDLVKHYQINPAKITVAYPGHKDIYSVVKDKDQIQAVQDKYQIDKPYIIYIGTIQPRKNLLRLIDAFEKIDHLKLVIVGKTHGVGREGWMFDDVLARPKKLGIEERVIFTGFVPDGELNLLLNGAVAFVLPSLYEGFGIPVVDAMSVGIPVIVSNVSSLPEVVGKAGLLIDPYSTVELEQAIRTISSDKKLHTKLSKLSLRQASKFSWEKMTKEVLQVFEKVGQ